MWDKLGVRREPRGRARGGRGYTRAELLTLPSLCLGGRGQRGRQLAPQRPLKPVAALSPHPGLSLFKANRGTRHVSRAVQAAQGVPGA